MALAGQRVSFSEVTAPAKKPLIIRMGAKPGVVRRMLLDRSKRWVKWDTEAADEAVSYTEACLALVAANNISISWSLP